MDQFTLGDHVSLSYTSEELKQFECPVCWMIPRQNPVYQCLNGHIICSGCHSSVNICPQCRENLGTNRNLMLESILDKLPFPCQFRGDGCLDVMPRKSIAEHEIICCFRTINCVDISCNLQLSMSKLVAHVKVCHSERIPTVNGQVCNVRNSHLFRGTLSMQENILESSDNLDWHPFQLCFDGNFFYLRAKRVEGLLYLWLNILEIDYAHPMDYEYILTIQDEDGSTEYRCKSQPLSLDLEFSDIQSSGKLLLLTNSIVHRLVYDDQIFWKIIIGSSVNYY